MRFECMVARCDVQSFGRGHETKEAYEDSPLSDGSSIVLCGNTSGSSVREARVLEEEIEFKEVKSKIRAIVAMPVICFYGGLEITYSITYLYCANSTYRTNNDPLVCTAGVANLARS